MPQKYLFLCAMGQNRSPTAARVARDIAQEKGLDIEMTYGGIDYVVNSLHINRPLPWSLEDYQRHFQGFDRIFVMEKYMKEELEKLLQVPPQKVICMHIPDEYGREDPVLVGILQNSLGIFL